MRKVSRKWGHYRTLFRTKRFALKILVFDRPLGKQRHFHRNEKWFFVGGRGVFVTEDFQTSRRELVVSPAIRTVPPRTWHDFIPHQPSTVIEFQWGNKVTEEDIERA